MHTTPALAQLKSGSNITSNFKNLVDDLAQWRADKGYPKECLSWWLRHQEQENHPALETLVGRFLMRLPYDANAAWLQQALFASLYGTPSPHAAYRGTPHENVSIDEAIAESGDESGWRDRIRRGAVSFFSLEGFQIPPWAGIRTPIVIVGAGAAGIIAARTLLNAGYRNVRVLDETGHYGGIWRHPHVQLVRNNPSAFSYEDFRVEAAPGSGLAITRFLEHLVHPVRRTGMPPLPPVIQGKIIHILPGDLDHTVIYTDAQNNTQALRTPILINALGLGAPLPLSRPGTIETDVPDAQGGIRWQQIISRDEAERLRGKRVVFVGLGNSTMEMLVQIQQLNKDGYKIAYTVLTHHSREALRYPRYPDRQGKQFFRDLDHPHLTGVAGDLDHIETAFEQAWNSSDRDQEEIIPEVSFWTIDRQTAANPCIVVTTRSSQDTSPRRISYHQVYSLIGYGHSAEDLHMMGLIAHGGKGSKMQLAHDVDGECQRAPGESGRERLHPGYFGFGALLASPNAQVIPGMLFRLSDLLVGVALRSTEYTLRRSKKQR